MKSKPVREIWGIRELPFPKTSNFTPETVRQIKAIPDEVLHYSKEEEEWMERAIQNIEYILALANLSDSQTKLLIARREEIEAALKENRKSSPGGV